MARESQLSYEPVWDTAQTYLAERERVRALTPPGTLVIRKSDVEIRTLSEWRLYASPRGGETQWRDYRPAKELARAWCPDGLGPMVPPETRALIMTRPEFNMLEIDEALPEQPVRFDTLPGEPPPVDLMAHGRAGEEEFVMAVLAKGDEPFGAYVSDELVAASRRLAQEVPVSSFERITRLGSALFRPRTGGEPYLGELRYQLLLAIAGVLAHAGERGVRKAVLMVHEFRNHTTNDAFLTDNQRDLERVVKRLASDETRALPMNQLVGPFEVPGNEFVSGNVELYIGKARRELLALDF
jgi:hypothetical protein